MNEERKYYVYRNVDSYLLTLLEEFSLMKKKKNVLLKFVVRKDPKNHERK